MNLTKFNNSRLISANIDRNRNLKISKALLKSQLNWIQIK